MIIKLPHQTFEWILKKNLKKGKKMMAIEKEIGNYGRM